MFLGEPARLACRAWVGDFRLEDHQFHARNIPVSNRARAVLGVVEIKVLADRGDFSGELLLECAGNGITTYVPKRRAIRE